MTFCSDVLQLASHMDFCFLFRGTATSEQGELMSRWQTCSMALKECLNSIVLPIGSISVGVCRHRALLYKVMASTLFIKSLARYMTVLRLRKGTSNFLCKIFSFSCHCNDEIIVAQSFESAHAPIISTCL